MIYSDTRKIKTLNLERYIMANNQILEGITILYAEDEFILQEGITETLNLFDINVLCAKNGEEGLSIFKDSSKKIDLILTDIKMPKLDGIGMIKEIRKINKDIPIIITTSHQETNFFIESIESNISAYILKPIDIYKLKDSLVKSIEAKILKEELLVKNIRLEKEIEKNEESQKIILTQSRFAAMGEMIAMIAHQWRQPLASIGTVSFSLKHKLLYEKFDLEKKEGRKEQTEFFCKKFDDIELYVQNLTSTIDDFKNFFKSDKEIIKTKIENTIQNSLKIIQKDLEDNNIDLRLNFLSQAELCIYENEIMHVFINILKNAKEKLLEQNIKNPMIEISTININDSIKIEIQDNGGGIEVENINKIFDPYFSTKKEKNGTGLGLYMSKIIIETNHHGKISVYNTKEGVCFSIILKKTPSLANRSSL